MYFSTKRGIATFFHNAYNYRTFFVEARQNLAEIGGLPMETQSFRALWSGGPVIPCGDMRQSFTDALIKWFLDNFPMFTDSFSVLSIYYIVQGWRGAML